MSFSDSVGEGLPPLPPGFVIPNYPVELERLIERDSQAAELRESRLALYDEFRGITERLQDCSPEWPVAAHGYPMDDGSVLVAFRQPNLMPAGDVSYITINYRYFVGSGPSDVKVNVTNYIIPQDFNYISCRSSVLLINPATNRWEIPPGDGPLLQRELNQLKVYPGAVYPTIVSDSVQDAGNSTQRTKEEIKLLSELLRWIRRLGRGTIEENISLAELQQGK
jgi:hypothetical protein